jgi:peptidoglycan/xylan/chitin deacetylase (PgdA/CDA1 family)/CelD/BcsL family acetyltransferase involved in cellulose biosynthesis
VRVVRYRTWEDLQPLAARWNELLSTSSSDTLFLTWEWCEAWWKNYGAARPLFVLAAWEEDRLLGVAPFYVDGVQRWGTNWKCLRIIGDGSNDSDYLDCFAALGREAEAMRAFMDYLQAESAEWDWLETSATPADSICLNLLTSGARERGWHIASESIPCTTLPLPASWEGFLAGLRPRFRTKVRSCLAELEQQIRSVPRECTSEAELDSWLGELFDLHARRWNTKGQSGVFGAAAKRSFYGDVSRSTLKRGWLAFHRLDWTGRPLALQYGFRYANRFYLLQEGYDPSFETVRPGMALRTWLMRYWIQAGLAEYDFLAGVTPAKMEWGSREKMSVRVVLAPSSSAAWVCLKGPQLRRRLKDRIRDIVPEVLLSARQHLRDRKREPTSSNEAGFSATPATLKGLALRTAACAYRNTPLGSAARHISSRYTLGAHGFMGLQRRAMPACQIFVYHRVNDDRDPFFYATPVAEFERQMEYLARNFRMASLDDLAGGSFPVNGHKCCVAVTFDDGYRDNFTYAFPILKKLGIPATVFLATGCIESGEIPWYDQVRLAFKLTMRPRFTLDVVGGPSASLETAFRRVEASERTLAWLRGLDESGRSRGLAQVFCELGVPAGLNLRNTMLRWEDIRLMAKQGIAFGAHTITHPVLAGLPVERLQEEIGGSKRTVEARLQLPVRHFAYPFGKPVDFGPQAKRVVQEAGFQTAATTVFGINGQEDDPFELKRLGLWERDMGLFGLRLDWYRMGGGSTPDESKQGVRAQ